jgi:eukaryotic-like serine/threonine-protein kinase
MSASTAGASPLGQTLAGRFKVTAFLGNARGGALYLAEQLPLGRNVTVKILDPMDADSPQRRRFFREAHALVKLTNPHIVRVIDLGNWGDRPYLVTENVEGRRLDDVFAEGPIDPLRLVQIARQVCIALTEAHASGLVHRDLRPTNILLVEQGTEKDFVKVMDFGLVKDLGAEEHDTSAEGLAIGSPWYVAPEQIRGGSVDPRTDVYALGVILYRGLAGRLPFSEQGTTELLRQQLDRAAPPIPEAVDLPTACRWTVATCLEKPPDLRFADMIELGHALRLCAVALIRPEWNRVSASLVEGRTKLPPNVPDDPFAHAAAPIATSFPWFAVVGVVALCAFLVPVLITAAVIAFKLYAGR